MRYVLVLMMVFYVGCDSKKLQTENEALTQQVAALTKYKERALACTEELSHNEQASKGRASAHFEMAREQVVLDEEWQKEKLSKLEKLIRRVSPDEEQAARIENSIFHSIRIGHGVFELFDAMQYTYMKQAHLIDPAEALTLIKSFIYGSSKSDKTRTSGLTHLFGAEEGQLLFMMDLSEFMPKKEKP